MLLSSLLILTSVIFVARIVTWLYKRKKLADYLLSKFPTEPTHPLCGHILQVAFAKDVLMATATEWIEKHGKYTVFVMPGYETYLSISDPKAAEKILMHTDMTVIRKADPYYLLEPWLGNGLLLSIGEKYHKRRKILTPAFHFNVLEQFIQVINKQSEILAQILKPRIGTGDFNIVDYVELFALDVICETSMGVCVNAQTSSDSEYAQSLRLLTDLGLKRFLSLMSFSKFLYSFTSGGKRMRRTLNIIREFTERIILQRRDQLLHSKLDNASDHGRPSFLDILLKSTIDGKPLSNTDISEEVNTFMFGGQDTVTSALSFILYLLSRHKHVQDRLYEEIADILNGTDLEEIPYSKLIDLRYLDMVIKESLRIYPPVPIIGRKLMEDTELNGVTVPGGTNVALMIYYIHHDKDSYPEPDKFMPERFDLSASSNSHPFAFIPFSAGVRNCIGQKYAWMEMRLAIVKLLMNYEFLPAISHCEIDLQPALTLKASNGVYMRIAERKLRDLYN